MKKNKIIIVGLLFVLFLNNSACKSQTKWFEKDFIRIEIDNGAFHSIKLLEEGLLCKTVDTNFVSFVEFFPNSDLDFSKIGKLEEYLNSEPLFNKNATIDDPSLVTSGGNYGGLEISIIRNSNLYAIYWIDGDCEYLEKCLALLNDIIPTDKRDMFSILFKH
ncbi:MAG: hypothetical protein A2W93_05590 [Bacteroidetes bacterium GWF2_43_63]|nr:MAG: hypothetical protein A2W94_07470 [Bacteroidetes bacterium GWE2_42_42]OFY55488.1 MAG: hypothetical protein A2W93_05590 [Bacteroidetes bacterium GWF2_43_63]HBG69965.1 hypothetical protein [Bacteroidales bacterium]HCB62608.1 hypothetical protein [Bacteroidales bacterium]HCY23728.1 hypothetical protein [Bacteroidales bacterium]